MKQEEENEIQRSRRQRSRTAIILEKAGLLLALSCVCCCGLIMVSGFFFGKDYVTKQCSQTSMEVFGFTIFWCLFIGMILYGLIKS